MEEERRRMPSLLPMSVGVGGRPDMGTKFSYLVLGSMDRHTWPQCICFLIRSVAVLLSSPSSLLALSTTSPTQAGRSRALL